MKAGDTLSAIAKAQLGDANAYMKIFDANKDQLTRSGQDQAGPGAEAPVVTPTHECGRALRQACKDPVLSAVERRRC